MHKSEHIVLLLAGGKGCRMQSEAPKQFIEVAGAPVISHTMRVFQQHPLIDHIHVVCAPEWSGMVETTAQEGGITKFAGIFHSGENSIDSLRNGILGLQRTYPNTNPLVLTHESVRPLITERIITDNLNVAQKYGNAITAIRSNEAYMVSHDGLSSETSITRDLLFRAQTPQTFYLYDLLEMFEKAAHQNITTSQSLYTLMTEVGPRTLFISPGHQLNFKITYPEDLDTLEALLTYRKEMNDYDR